MTFVRFNTRLGKPKPIAVKCLLDSGASGSLIDAKFMKKLRVKRASTTTVWSTPAGEMSTSTMVNGMFTIPELQEKKLIEWPLHVVEGVGTYDMILGRDVMSFLGIDILFSQKVVTWNGSELPFKPISADVDKDCHVEQRFDEIGLNAFEDLPNLSPKQAGAVRDLLQTSTNTEFLQSINGITGVVDSGASKFSTFDDSDFVEGTFVPAEGETIMKGIAGGLTIRTPSRRTRPVPARRADQPR